MAGSVGAGAGAVAGSVGAVAAGPADAPAIVFIHGTRLTGAMWTPQLAALAERLPDDRRRPARAREHARTSPSPWPARPTPSRRPSAPRRGGRADRRRPVARRVRGDGARGASARGGPRAGAVGCDGRADWRPDRPVSGDRRVIDQVDLERLDRVNAWFFRRRFPPEIAEPIVAGGFWSRGGAAALRSVAGERFVPRLAAYPGPSLILNGELDLPFRLFAASFAAAAQDARRVRLAGASHLANLDRPAAFSEAVRRFARSLPD